MGMIETMILLMTLYIMLYLFKYIRHNHDQIHSILDDLQGAPKKMHHSNLYLISVLKVGFYFFTYVLESEC